MKLVFQPERDNDFFKCCERIRATEYWLPISEIAKKAVYCQAQSFYLSSSEIEKIFSRIRRGIIPTTLRLHKLEMYEEIARRYKELKNTEKLSLAIDDEPAPRFYISEVTASNIYYRLLKQEREKNAIRNSTNFRNNFFRL